MYLENNYYKYDFEMIRRIKKPRVQNERFGLRLNIKDLQRMQVLINHYEISGSELIRWLIQREYDNLESC
jgi:hypothetical protein